MIKKILSNPAIFDLFNRAIGERQARKDFVREYINASPGDKILDIACGTGPLLDFLGDVDYTGFDHAQDYINSAREKHAARIAQGSARFFCDSVENFAVAEEGRYDIVMAGGLLHHLDEDSSIRVLQTGRRALRQGGRFIALDNILVPRQGAIARWIILQDRGKFVRTLEAYGKLFAQVFPDTDLQVRSNFLRIPYTHVIATAIKR